MPLFSSVGAFLFSLDRFAVCVGFRRHPNPNLNPAFSRKPSSPPIFPPTGGEKEMRPLDEKEATLVFEKVFKFTGKNLKHIIERPALEGPPASSFSTPPRYCFRLHKNRVFYASESLVRCATNISRDRLVSVSTCIGRFTKSGAFRLTVQSLDLLAAHARCKVWLKPTAEMSFLYGNHVLKSGLGRITDGTAAGDGVVVFSMSDLPLGFGVAAKSTQDCRKMDPNGIVVLHQVDIGEYLRMEDDL